MTSDKVRDSAFLDELDALFVENNGQPFTFEPSQGRIHDPKFYEKCSTPGGRIIDVIEQVTEYMYGNFFCYYVEMHDAELTDL